MSEKEETQKLLLRMIIDGEVTYTHEWIHAYPKEEYPKLLTPRTEIKVKAEAEFFDPEFLEYTLFTEEEP